MNVIVDTPIWSLAFRRREKPINPYVDILRDLIEDGRVTLLGVVRQEILSGIRHSEQFERLKDLLRAFPNLTLNIKDYELAASYFNICRNKGVQGANTDFLICAAASRRNYEIFTADKDFENFSQLLPISIYKIAR